MAISTGFWIWHDIVTCLLSWGLNNNATCIAIDMLTASKLLSAYCLLNRASGRAKKAQARPESLSRLDFKVRPGSKLGLFKDRAKYFRAKHANFELARPSWQLYYDLCSPDLDGFVASGWLCCAINLSTTSFALSFMTISILVPQSEYLVDMPCPVPLVLSWLLGPSLSQTICLPIVWSVLDFVILLL